MPTIAGDPSRELRRALRGYLLQHPDAADGVTGIRMWWLPVHLQGVTDTVLRTALDELVRRNEMQRTAMLDGTELYASIPALPSRDAREQRPRPTHH
jgi:hypothetical protein